MATPGQEIPIEVPVSDAQDEGKSQREKDLSVYDMLRKMSKKTDRGGIGAPELVIKKKDFGPEWASTAIEAKTLASTGELQSAIDLLLKLEKKTRSAMEFDISVEVCALLMELCIAVHDWDAINVNLVVISKRRQQHRKVIGKIAKQGIAELDNARQESKEEELRLITTLREISEGKIFLEVERARLTKRLASIREDEGKIVEAADILQEVKVETYGTMDKLEKTAFILEQVRLCLAKKDHDRAFIIAKKIDKKVLCGKEFQELKLKYYNLLIEYHTIMAETLSLCRDYVGILNTPSILQDSTKWQEALSHACIFCVLSEFGVEQNTMLHTLQKMQATRLEHPNVASMKQLLKHFSDSEIHSVFTNTSVWKDLSAKWAEMLHLRILQHNVRIVSKYYSRISTNRLAQLLLLDEAKAERVVCDMVCPTNEECMPLFARIDRPKGVISFSQPEDANTILNDWSNDTTELLSLMQKTRHMIDRENMLMNAAKKKKKGKQ